MIVRQILDWRIIIRRSWKRIGLIALVAFIIAFLHEQQGYNFLALSTLPASILGVAISFLVGFRVNSAYERWWEARRIWGAVVNDSRSIARQCMTFFFQTDPTEDHIEDKAISFKKEFIYRQIAFAHALKCQLRKQDPFAEMQPFLKEEELQLLRTKKQIPNTLIQMQGEQLQKACRSGLIDDYRHMQMDTKLSSLCDSMGACERIKSTVFPRQYGYYSTLFITIYSFMIPFVLVKETGYIVIPFSIIIGFIFYALDMIANGIEKPFENTINDTPMSAICRNIEIHLREQLGENDLPAPLEPVNGFLD